MQPNIERRPARNAEDVSHQAAKLAEEFRRLHARHGDAVEYHVDYPQRRAADDRAFQAADGRRGAGQAQAPGAEAEVIRGLAIPFHSLSEPLGGGAFRERFDPSAIRRTLDEKIDVRALVGHDPIKVLGRVSSKTLALHVDNLGLHFSVDPPNTSYARDLIALVSRGDVVNASFGFQTIEDTWTMTAGTPLRTVVDARIFEISIVTWGSYTATAVMVS